MAEKTAAATAVSKEEVKTDYSDPKFLDTQIKMAEQALQQMEMEFTARSNMLRGILNALQAIKEGKPMVSKVEYSPLKP